MERGDSPRVAAATFFAPAPLVEGRLSLDESAAHHARVRRLAVGDLVRLVDGAGTVGSGYVARVAKAALELDVDSTSATGRQPAIHLFVPVADRDRMLWLAEKAAELAVASWRPVTFARSRSVSPRGEGEQFAAKVRLRMIAALEQSAGAWLPEIHAECDVDAAATTLRELPRLALDRRGTPMLAKPFAGAVALLVGPEGGIEPEELEVLERGGWQTVSLGETMLRFETAAVAATAVARAALDPGARDLRTEE